jgi:hypothetical protein
LSQQVIVYENSDGLIAVMYPADCGLSITEIARKDVPAGTPYLLVNAADLPDGAYRDAWTADFSEPDGVGIGPDAWFAERAAQQENN